MATLLLALHPGQPSQALLAACLTHDVAERWVGDTPATCKWDIAPGVDLPLKRAEHHINAQLGINYQLTQVEEYWLKALDLAELWAFCMDQMAMGNTLVENMMHKCWELLQGTNVPPSVKQWVNAHQWERTDDSFGMSDGK